MHFKRLVRAISLIFAVTVSAMSAHAATFTVTSAADSGLGSLRQAVLDSNGSPGSDTIIFGSLFSSPQTITLASVITINPAAGDSLTVMGPGANLLTISGNNAVRIFAVSSGDTAFISGINFTSAVTGAISNVGALTISDCSFNANTNNSGGAITSGSSGTISLAVLRCSFSNNTNTAPGVNGTGGAAIFSGQSSTTITDSTFSNNVTTSGGQGGAVFINSGDMTINGSRFTGNSTTSTSQNSFGGAIAVQGNGQLTINASVLDGNSTTRSGGAIYYQPNSSTGPPFLAINNSTISNNIANSDSDATGDGGGLFLTGTGSVSIVGSTINGNLSRSGSSSTGDGGGIDTSVSTTITNSTISGNTAQHSGGGLIISGTSTVVVNISNSTIASNTATVNGGGIYNPGATTPPGLFSTIVANNTAAAGTDVSGTINSSGFNLIRSTAGAVITGNNATNVTGMDPMLGPLANNGGETQTHGLLTGSPAIDKGSSGGLSTDQRHETRPVDDPGIGNAAGGDGADIGSYETQP